MIGEASVRSDFVVIQASWTTNKALAVLQLDPTETVIVALREGDRDYWYLYPRAEVLSALARLPPDTSVHDGLNLHEYTATDVVDRSELAGAQPGRYVVVDRGLVQGFVEPVLGTLGASALNGESRRRRVRRGAAAAPPPLVRRSIEARFPSEVVLQQPATLWVALRNALARAAGPSAAIEAPAGASIDIFVQVKQGFVVDGDDRKPLDFPAADADDEDDPETFFSLRPVEAGTGRIRVLAYHENRRLAAITIETTIVEVRAPATAGPTAAPQEITQPVAELRGRKPDLVLLVSEERSQGAISLDLTLDCRDRSLGYVFRRFPRFSLQTNPDTFFAEFFRDIENLPLETPRDRANTTAKLEAKGEYLVDTLLPPALRQALWTVRDRITSIEVQSDEPWIPWELCRLTGENERGELEGFFLCERYQVTRWIWGRDGNRTAPLDLPLSNIGLVVPRDSGLPFADEERDVLLGLHQDGVRTVKRVDPSYLMLRKELAQGPYDGWHFVGHGAAQGSDPDRSEMSLENEEVLTPQDLSGAIKARLERNRPLVFLNACQLGRRGLALTGLGGWANRFLEAGAGAFLGAYWEVSDGPAQEFAEVFYHQLIEKKLPIGQAVHAARSAIKDSTEDPTTWLAYTVFADPYARVP